MAKKKDEVPNANSVPNKDIIQRLNFMFQASVYLGAAMPVPAPATTSSKRTKRARKMNVHDLSKSYVNSMKIVANKTMVKMCVTFWPLLYYYLDAPQGPRNQAHPLHRLQHRPRPWFHSFRQSKVIEKPRTYHALPLHLVQVHPPHTCTPDICCSVSKSRKGTRTPSTAPLRAPRPHPTSRRRKSAGGRPTAWKRCIYNVIQRHKC